jgi:type IV pilus assembly protein PilV
MKAFGKSQQGVLLLEAMIAVLIFSLGILAIVALQAASIRTQGDAKQRAEASYLANQLIGRMWTDRGNLAGYAHNAAGAFSCDSAVGTSATSASASLTTWLQNVSATLPNGTSGAQRIVVGAGNLVTITMCWRAGNNTRETRRYEIATQIAG